VDQRGEGTEAMMSSSTDTVLDIVVVNSNDASGLERTLQSVRDQELSSSKFRVIVVDAASHDGSLQVAERLARVTDIVISERDAGVYDGMNKGINLGSSPYVLFLNSGDWLTGPASLTVMVNLLARQPEWAIVGARHHFGGLYPPKVIPNLPHNVLKHALGLRPHCHQSTVFSRRLLTQVGGYALDVGFVADFLLFLQAGRIARPAEDATVCVEYAGGGLSALSASQIPAWQHRARVRAFRLNLPLRALDLLWSKIVRGRDIGLQVRTRLRS